MAVRLQLHGLCCPNALRATSSRCSRFTRHRPPDPVAACRARGTAAEATRFSSEAVSFRRCRLFCAVRCGQEAVVTGRDVRTAGHPRQRKVPGFEQGGQPGDCGCSCHGRRSADDESPTHRAAQCISPAFMRAVVFCGVSGVHDGGLRPGAGKRDEHRPEIFSGNVVDQLTSSLRFLEAAQDVGVVVGNVGEQGPGRCPLEPRPRRQIRTRPVGVRRAAVRPRSRRGCRRRRSCGRGWRGRLKRPPAG